MIDACILFTIKLVDQLLRTEYLMSIKRHKKQKATVLIGIQHLFFIYITVTIVKDYSIQNIIALTTSTMMGTYLTMRRDEKNQE